MSSLCKILVSPRFGVTRSILALKTTTSMRGISTSFPSVCPRSPCPPDQFGTRTEKKFEGFSLDVQGAEAFTQDDARDEEDGEEAYLDKIADTLRSDQQYRLIFIYGNSDCCGSASVDSTCSSISVS